MVGRATELRAQTDLPLLQGMAEFVIGPRLYVVQVDGRPSSTVSADFDKLMRTVHESASSAE